MVGYTINKTIVACLYVGGKCLRLKDCFQNFTVSLEASLLDQLFIFRRIFQPQTLSSNISTTSRGLFTNYAHFVNINPEGKGEVNSFADRRIWPPKANGLQTFAKKLNGFALFSKMRWTAVGCQLIFAPDSGPASQ